MNYYIRKNEQSKFGYDFVELNDTGLETVTELRTKTTDDFLKCPKNQLDRVYIGLGKLSKHDFSTGDFQLDTPTKKAGFSTDSGSSQKTPSTPTKGLEEYLNDEDKALYLALVSKAQLAQKTETLRKQIEALTKQLTEMTTEEVGA